MCSYQELGKQNIGNRVRPILTVVESKSIRDGVLSKAKNLKEAGKLYERIYIKRDEHPSKEWMRMREVEKG